MSGSAVEVLRRKQINSSIGYFEDEFFQEEVLKKLDSLNEVIQQVAQNSQQSKIVYMNASDSKIITEREVIVTNLKKLIVELEENYEDISDRLEYFCMIKENLKKLKSVVDKNSNKYYYRTCIILHDSILHLKSEKVTLPQIVILKYLISKLSNLNINEEEFDDIDDILVDNDLEWIPECDPGDDD